MYLKYSVTLRNKVVTKVVSLMTYYVRGGPRVGDGSDTNGIFGGVRADLAATRETVLIGQVGDAIVLYLQRSVVRTYGVRVGVRVGVL